MFGSRYVTIYLRNYYYIIISSTPNPPSPTRKKALSIAMGIKQLEAYFSERGLLQTLPLTVLADTRLGIDASHYLTHILENPPSREPLLAATGGLPLALSTRIEADLRVLEKIHIKPVFVFSGLLPAKRPKPSTNDFADSCRERKDAWAKYEAGQEEQAQKLFETRPCITQWDIWRPVLRIFRQRNVEYIVAPYMAWAQLIYLQRHAKSYIHAIYGSSETLLYYNVDKLITNIDFSVQTPVFKYISKKTLMSELSINNEEQFLDIGLLSGCEYLPTFPGAYDQNIKSLTDMIKHYKTGHATVNAFQEHPTVKQLNYLELFFRARSLVRFALILNSDGAASPLPLALSSQTSLHNHNAPHINPADVPQDLHEIFTNRLPDEVYFYLSRGLIGPQVLVWLSTGQILEPPPLDSGEATEYRRFIKEVITENSHGPRAMALTLISSVLHNSWGSKRVTAFFWFDTPSTHPKPIAHNSPSMLQQTERVSGWNVPSAVVDDELRRQNSSTIDFTLCLGATSQDKYAVRTRSKGNSPRQLEKKDEVVANVIWRFLELRGFLTNSHIHTAYARAMFSAITKTMKVNDKYQDPLYLFLELVRAGVVHGELWSGRAYSGGPSFGNDEEKKCMLLVMRVLSILPLNFKPESWSAPLSRELLVFNSFVRSLSRALRSLIEMTALNLLIREDARRHREDLLDISLSLPFQTDVNTGFGVLAKVYLDALTHLNGGICVRDANGEGVAESKETALEICEENFTGVKLPKAEVSRGFRFWDTTLAAIRSLHVDKQISPELAESFENADAWLKPMRP